MARKDSAQGCVALGLLLLGGVNGCGDSLDPTGGEGTVGRIDASLPPPISSDASMPGQPETDASAPLGNDASSLPNSDAGSDAGIPVLPAEPVPECETDISGMPTRMEVPGVSVGIVRDGAVACVSTAGFANIEEDLPVSQDTPFAWASVSKTVTAVAVMILVDRGMIDLDDDISDYLPYDVRNPRCSEDAITFRHLLTHRSSIVDGSVYGDLYTIGDSPLALGDFIREYVVPGGDYYDADDNFGRGCPGSNYSYSNIAISIAGPLIEQITEMTFDQFCRANIFDPLRMDETSFHLAELDESKVAMPYRGDSLSNFRANGHNGFPTYPDGLLRTSVANLARFLAMMSNEGELDGQRILSAATVRQVRNDELTWYFDGGLFGHTGSDPGTSSQMFYDPDDKAGALIVANGNYYGTGAADRLLRTLLAEARDN